MQKAGSVGSNRKMCGQTVGSRRRAKGERMGDGRRYGCTTGLVRKRARSATGPQSHRSHAWGVRRTACVRTKVDDRNEGPKGDIDVKGARAGDVWQGARVQNEHGRGGPTAKVQVQCHE